MFYRINRSALDSARTVARKSTAWATFAKDAVGGLLTTAHHTLSLIGFGVLIVIGLMILRPDIAHEMRSFIPALPFATSPLVSSVNTQASRQQQSDNNNAGNLSNANTALDMPSKGFHSAVSAIPVNNKIAAAIDIKKPHGAIDHETIPQQKIVSNWLSKRYRVAGDAANMLVAMSYSTAKEINIDPLLILAVMAIESGFNPFAESPMGAQGLMQVMSKVHHDKFQKLGGIKEALNPHANIRVGALILKDYVTRGGSIEAGLKSYVGASAFATDAGYGSRVMVEYNRLKELVSSKAVPAPLPMQMNTPAMPSTEGKEAKAGKVDQLAAL